MAGDQGKEIPDPDLPLLVFTPSQSERAKHKGEIPIKPTIDQAACHTYVCGAPVPDNAAPITVMAEEING